MTTAPIPAQPTSTEITKAMNNPLAEVVKKDEISSAMKGSRLEKKLLPNQISVALDKYENRMIKKRRFTEK